MEPIYQNISNLQNNEEENYPIYEIKSLPDKQHLINTSDVLLIEYYATWCNPCSLIRPNFNKLWKKYHQPKVGVYIVKQNIDDNIDGIASKVGGVPCFHFWVKGKHYTELTTVGGDVETVDKTLFNVLQTLNK